MSSPGHTESTGEQHQPQWLPSVTEMLRSRGYLTLSVRIGYELVLIVSGPSGEAAIIDLSHEPSSAWNDAWTGVRQTLPRFPVVAVVPSDNEEQFDLDDRIPITRVSDPVDAQQLVLAVEHLLSPASP